MKFLVRKRYSGKNLLGQNIDIPENIYIESDNKFILWYGLPVCIYRSKLANEHFVWADDGFEHSRTMFEESILFTDRLKIWSESVPIYDDLGNVTSYKTVNRSARFSPEEVEYIKKNFSHLVLPGDGLVFNDLFYIGSDIKDIEKLARYIER